MHRGEIGRESGDVVIILARVINQGRHAQFTACPSQVKRMCEKMLCCDLAIDGIEVCIHIGSTKSCFSCARDELRTFFAVPASLCEARDRRISKTAPPTGRRLQGAESYGGENVFNAANRNDD